MSDNIDIGDVSEFDEPPVHLEELKRQADELSTRLVEFLMEEMAPLAELNLPLFFREAGDALGHIGRVYSSRRGATDLLNTLISAYRGGMSSAEGMLEEEEEE